MLLGEKGDVSISQGWRWKLSLGREEALTAGKAGDGCGPSDKPHEVWGWGTHVQEHRGQAVALIPSVGVWGLGWAEG